MNVFAVPSSMPWGDEVPGFIQLVYISTLFVDVSGCWSHGEVPAWPLPAFGQHRLGRRASSHHRPPLAQQAVG